MIKNYNIAIKLIDRYDYGGVLDLLTEIGAENTPAAILIDSCRYAVNFDFKMALKILYHLNSDKKNNVQIKYLISNLTKLRDGDPDSIFGELLENTKFQIVSEEYIDFLGRVYRFKEAIFKYMFIRSHMGDRRVSMLQPIFQKRHILNILRKRYHIHNYNINYAIEAYLKKYHSDNIRFMDAVHILNSRKMNALMELRNKCIVGHGFFGVSSEQLRQAYGNPYTVIDDLKKCLDNVGIHFEMSKYIKLNKLIKSWINEVENYMNYEKF